MDDKVIPHVVREVYTSHAAYSGGLRCDAGGCAAVFETDQGTHFIVGRRLTAEEKAQLPIDAIEDAVEVPDDLLEQLVHKLKK